MNRSKNVLITFCLSLFCASASYATQIQFATTAINATGSIVDGDCVIVTLEIDDTVASGLFDDFFDALVSVSYQVVGGVSGGFTTINPSLALADPKRSERIDPWCI